MKSLKNIISNYKKVTIILWKVSWKGLLFLVAMTIITGTIPTVSTIVMQRIINLLSEKSKKVEVLIAWICIYMICDIVLSIINIFLTYVSNIYEKKITLELDMRILKKTKTLQLYHFENSESYNLIQRAQVENGLQIFNYFLSITSIVKYIILIVGSIIILLSWHAWAIALVSIAAIVNTVLMLKISRYQYDILRKRTEKSREKWYYQYLLTKDIAFKEIKIYGLHEYFINKYKKIADSFIKQDKDVTKKTMYIGGIRIILEHLGNILIMSNIFIDTFYNRINIGDTVAYLKSISNIKNNINSLLMQIVSIYKDTLYISQLFEFLELPIKSTQNTLHCIETIQSIQIRNLSYKYRNTEKYVLRNINLEINEQDHIILVGKNGSGKSTLIKLIAGFYDDYEGEILINGISLDSINKDSLRKRIGVLFQDFNKYEMTVRENVGIGDLKKINDDTKIVESLKFSNVPVSLCENLEKQLGFWFDGGCQLSGGEWLKIGLSRVFLKKSDLLILDEPNAALDPIGEAKIIKNIQELVTQSMSIIVTHRIHNIEKMQGKIVVIDDGKIVSMGMHSELLVRCSVYQELFENSK